MPSSLVTTLVLTALVAATAVMHTADATAAADSNSIVYSWEVLDYTWPSKEARDKALADKTYIPENNALAGVKVFEGEYYVTVPRWRTGVPASLNKVVVVDGKPLLQPYPSWEMQSIDNHANLLYIQSMEIDPQTGFWWLLDVGRLHIFDRPESQVNTPPKLVIWDARKKRTERVFVFPNEVASWTQSFMNDIAVDHARGVAYMTDAGTGALVTYDFIRNTAARWESLAHTKFEPGYALHIDGISYPDLKIPTDGIALDPAHDLVYFCALTSRSLKAVSGAALRHALHHGSEVKDEIVRTWPKPPSDGLAFSDNGKLYFGDLTAHSVHEWDPDYPSRTPRTVLQDATTMQWPDTFAFTEKGDLVVAANGLHRFFANKMSFQGGAHNFFIHKLPIEGNSYFNLEGPPAQGHCGVAGTLHFVILGIVIGLVLSAIVSRCVTSGACKCEGGAGGSGCSCCNNKPKTL